MKQAKHGTQHVSKHQKCYRLLIYNITDKLRIIKKTVGTKVKNGNVKNNETLTNRANLLKSGTVTCSFCFGII